MFYARKINHKVYALFYFSVDRETVNLYFHIRLRHRFYVQINLVCRIFFRWLTSMLRYIFLIMFLLNPMDESFKFPLMEENISVSKTYLFIKKEIIFFTINNTDLKKISLKTYLSYMLYFNGMDILHFRRIALT